MTEETNAEHTASESTTGTDFGSITRRVRSRIVGDPLLCVPFFLAGIALTIIDELRRHDPIPVSQLLRIQRLGFSVDVVLIPSGSRAMRRTLGGLLDLHPRLLVWALGLEVVGFGIVVLAGYVTIARALDRGWSARSAGTYLFYVGLWTGLFWLLGPLYIPLPLPLVPLWLPLVALWLLALVHLFAVPAAIVNGAGLLEAARRSHEIARDREWTLLALVAFFGALVWLIGLLPVGSTPVSFTVVGAFHAVAVAVVFETRTVSG